MASAFHGTMQSHCYNYYLELCLAAMLPQLVALIQARRQVWRGCPWAVLGGFLGFLETPWGSPRFFPSFTAKCLWPHVYPMWLSASLPMDPNSCRPPDPVQTQLSSIPVQQADAEPPEKQRQIQVMAQRLVLDANYAL